MFENFPLFPVQASTVAERVDALYFFLIAISIFFGTLIAAALVYFAIRYHRRSEDEQVEQIHGSLALEIAWSVIPFMICCVIFVWSADVFFSLHRVPVDAMEINVVGKRWMWKLQHMTGQREINTLHIPTGVPVKVTLTSEDVIHSFYIPAFRIKKDAVPGRYNTLWFEATRPGRYHLFCAEYCGTRHSAMIGWVEVMEPAHFQAWLSGEATGGSLATAGERLFQELACATCHKEEDQGRGPSLDGVYGSSVKLATGGSMLADEAYIRASILTPAAQITAGYQPVMPTYQGLVNEEKLFQLIAYIKELGVEPTEDAVEAPAASSAEAAQDISSP